MRAPPPGVPTSMLLKYWSIFPSTPFPLTQFKTLNCRMDASSSASHPLFTAFSTDDMCRKYSARLQGVGLWLFRESDFRQRVATSPKVSCLPSTVHALRRMSKSRALLCRHQPQMGAMCVCLRACKLIGAQSRCGAYNLLWQPNIGCSEQLMSQ